MEPMVAGFIGVGILLVMLVLGVHIGITLTTAGFIGWMLVGRFDMMTNFDIAAMRSVTTIYFQIAKFVFASLPLFIFMGLVAARGGVSRDLYEALSIWLGRRLRAALGVATVLACTAFGTISGSSLVTAAVFARVAAPEMRRQGYDRKIAYGVCAAAGSIGMLIPPSILLVVYGILSEESVGKLLIAGIVPGLLLAGLFSMVLVILSRIRPALFGTGPLVAPTCRDRLRTIPLVTPVLVIAVIMIGGIFGGIFTPSEAGAVAAVVVLIYVLFRVKGKERWPTVGRGIAESVSTSAMIFLILGGALVFSRMLAKSGITQTVLNGLVGLELSTTTLVIVLAVIYLVMGCFLDSISMLAITIPVIYPAIKSMGIDPIWYAMVVIMAIETGLITPPVGLNVYGTYGVAEPDVRLEDIFFGCAPFFFSFLVAVILIIAFPAMTTTLPNLMIQK